MTSLDDPKKISNYLNWMQISSKSIPGTNSIGYVISLLKNHFPVFIQPFRCSWV